MKSTFIKYLVLSIFIIAITEFTKIVLNTNELLYQSLSEQLSAQQIKRIFTLQEKWRWIGFVFVPIYLLLKTVMISSVLYIGVFFNNKEVKYKDLWSVVLKAEFIFLLVPLIKVIWFYFFQTNYTLEDIQCFYPLSSLSIIGYKGLEPWFIYPFQTINLFELAYWLILAYYIGKITEKSMDNGLKIVASSYGCAVFFISHRLNALKKIADTIYVLDNKTITHFGNHNELITTDNFYSDYWSSF